MDEGTKIYDDVGNKESDIFNTEERIRPPGLDFQGYETIDAILDHTKEVLHYWFEFTDIHTAGNMMIKYIQEEMFEAFAPDIVAAAPSEEEG